MRREMERTLKKVDRLEDENNFLRSLNEDEDGKRAQETFGGQRRMISTLRDFHSSVDGALQAHHAVA